MSGNCTFIPLPKQGLSCQQLITQSSVLHYGALRKRGKVNSIADSMIKKLMQTQQQIFKWPRQYVVLVDGCLYVFNTETSSKPNCAVSLYGYSSVLPSIEDAQSKQPWPFKVTHAVNDKQFTLYFSAPTESDRKVWIEKIEKQLIYANSYNAAGALGVRPLRDSALNPVSRQSSTGSVGANPPSSPTSPGPKPGTGPGGVSESDLIYMNEVDNDEIIDDDDDDDNVNRAVYDDVDEMPDSMKVTLSSSPGPKTATSMISDVRRTKPRITLPFPAPTPAPASASMVKPTPVTKPKPVILPTSPPPKPNARVSPWREGGDTSNQGDGKKSVKGAWAKFSQKKGGKPIQDISPTQMNITSKEGNLSEDFEYLDITYDGYEEPIEPKKEGVNKEQEEFYWTGDAAEGDKLMRNTPVVGAYMVRDSKEPGSQTLLVRGESIVLKYKIQFENNEYRLGSSDERFTKLTDLINHYKSFPTPNTRLPLTKPYSTINR